MKHILLIFVYILLCTVSNSSDLFAGQLEIQIYPTSKLATELEYPTLYASLYGHTTLHAIKKQAITLKRLSKEQYNFFHFDAKKPLPLIEYLSQEHGFPRQFIAKLIGAKEYNRVNKKVMKCIGARNSEKLKFFLPLYDINFSLSGVYIGSGLLVNEMVTYGRSVIGKALWIASDRCDLVISKQINAAITDPLVDPIEIVYKTDAQKIVDMLFADAVAYKKQINIDSKEGKMGQTILMELCQNIVGINSTQTAPISYYYLQKILPYRPNVNYQNYEGDTPLHVVCNKKNFNKYSEAAFQLLLKHGANPHISNYKTVTDNTVGPVNNIVEREENEKAIHYLSQYKYQLPCLQNVLQLHYKIEEDSSNHFPVPVQDISYLIRTCLDVSNFFLAKDINRIIRNYIENDTIRVKNHRGDTLLHTLCSHRATTPNDVVPFLQIIDPNIPNNAGITALFRAAAYNPLLIEILLQHGADPKHIDLLGRAVTHYAIAAAHQKLQQLLLPDIYTNLLNTQDRTGATPLHYASDDCRLVTPAWAIKHGADPDIKDTKGDTPLHRFIRVDDYKRLYRLLASNQNNNSLGANPNIQNKEGNTPLHIALKDRKACEPVAMLLFFGANVYIQNNAQESPITLAEIFYPMHKMKTLIKDPYIKWRDTGKDDNCALLVKSKDEFIHRLLGYINAGMPFTPFCDRLSHELNPGMFTDLTNNN